MREISNALSDAIFTVCNKIISSAKFDKTYKCRIVSKVSDNKYIVMKDNIEHTVSSVFTYNVNDIVTVLLPENNWKNATIVYPQNKAVVPTESTFQLQNKRAIMTDVCSYLSSSQSNIGTIKISVPLYQMGSLYIDVWSYSYSGLYIAGGYAYGAANSWFAPRGVCVAPIGLALPIRFAEDASKNKYILIGSTTTEFYGFLGVSIAKIYSNYLEQDTRDMFSIELIRDETGLTVTHTVAGGA